MQADVGEELKCSKHTVKQRKVETQLVGEGDKKEENKNTQRSELAKHIYKASIWVGVWEEGPG